MYRDVSLQVKIIVAISALIIAGLGAIIYLGNIAQKKNIEREVNASSRIIADAIYSGIIGPMARGDNDAVGRILLDLNEDLAGGEVYIFGHHKKTATFASDTARVGMDVTSRLGSTELASAIRELLERGTTSDRAYEEWIDGKPYLTLLQPITHEEKCKECHQGAEDDNGGAVLVRLSLASLYSNMNKQVVQNIVTGVAGGTGIIVILYFIISSLVIRPVKVVISNLSQSARQVLSSADQAARSSLGLAEGATEQAASIEETSASLEEFSASTQNSIRNASQVDNHIKNANQAIEQANRDMTSLIQSIAEITRASEETSKIVKTIDEIAFQTNLLALNAAVEAARAGEAGAGFAVVAGEVRSLAMRAAAAAKNTTLLIDGTVEKVKEGSALVTRTNEDFKEVTSCMTTVGTLAGDIVAASQEQSEGIRQISQAVLEIDKVVQKNAAGAEESSASATELHNEAEQMENYVGDLISVIGGRVGNLASE